MRIRHFFLLAFPLLAACDNGLDPLDDKPGIELLSVSPTSVKAFEDEIVFRVKYTDGDGDLGSNVDSDRNVFLTDQRLDIVHEFRLKQLAPDGAEVPITGEFTLTLPSTIRVDSTGTSEQVTFSLYVVDRAGNESNEVVSQPIEVR